MYTYAAHVDKVVDGDTIDVTVDLGFKIYMKIRLRMAGIDAPEHSTDLGKTVSKFVADSLLNKDLVVQTTKPDKYGRTLATVLMQDGSVFNKTLLDKGYARAYDGGTKQTW